MSRIKAQEFYISSEQQGHIRRVPIILSSIGYKLEQTGEVWDPSDTIPLPSQVPYKLHYSTASKQLIDSYMPIKY